MRNKAGKLFRWSKHSLLSSQLECKEVIFPNVDLFCNIPTNFAVRGRITNYFSKINK